MDDNKEIISSHIFVFPFRWDFVKSDDYLDTCISNRLKIDKFIECLRDEWEIDSNVDNIIENKEIKNDRDYNTYSYFYDNVRDAIYGRKKYTEINKCKKISIKNTKYYISKVINKNISNRIVRCLNYNNINGSSTYEIYTVKKDKPYILKIKNIKLKVYDTGVATLSYFLENNEYSGDDILIINDYGRRIYPQYLSLEKAQESFLAKKISLNFHNEIIEEDFNYDSKENPTRISRTITSILGKKFKSIEKDLKKDYYSKKENILIRPVIDDRMFVICYYNDNTFSRVLTRYNDDEYLINDFWYQYIFIDNGGSTCADKKMKKELLLKSTYTRWKDYGSLFGISRYSFVLFCDESSFSKDVLFYHMNTIYYEMVILALVQRASILRFSDETSRIASFGKKNITKQIKKLQECYIRFVNTIYFREVTAQEQGIELYDKLTEFMRIEKEVKRLDEEIDEIQRYITLETSEKTNELINLITYAGLTISVMSLVYTSYESHLLMFSFFALTLVCIYLIKFIKDRRG